MIKEVKSYDFELKSLSEAGQFEGLLSVYNVVDLGGDLIEPGAFTKTLQEQTFIPCRWEHQHPIGKMLVKGVPEGLWIEGQLVMDIAPGGGPAVPKAYEAYALMKAGVVKGLSIGYRTIKKGMKDGIRHLKELALLEGSIVTFPMNPLAQITGVKSADFTETLSWVRTLAAKTQAMDALYSTLDEILALKAADDALASMDLYIAEKVIAESDAAISNFRQAYLGILPSYMDSWSKSATAQEAKAGRTISSATADQIRGAIAMLQALLDGTSGTMPDDTEDMVSMGKAAAVPTKAADPLPEPDELHSWMTDLLKRMA